MQVRPVLLAVAFMACSAPGPDVGTTTTKVVTIPNASAAFDWESEALALSDEVSRVFGEIVVQTEFDRDRRGLIISVNGSPDEVVEYLGSGEPIPIPVEVRGGYLPVETVSEEWERIEAALAEEGLVLGGGLNPNRIEVIVNDAERASAVVETLGIRPDIEVVFEEIGPPPPGPATWRVAPGQKLAPDTVEIDLLVTEVGCASGRSADGRIEPTNVLYRATEIVVTLEVMPIPGFADCPGNPETPYRLALTEPLGNRTLVDGYTPR